MKDNQKIDNYNMPYDCIKSIVHFTRIIIKI